MDSGSHTRKKRSQDANTNQLLQELNERFHKHLLIRDEYAPRRRRGAIFSLRRENPSSHLLNIPREIRSKILYYVLCPADTYYCYTGFGRVMELRWGGFGNIGHQPIVLPKGLPTAACLRGLPTVLAVNEQLQEETLDVLYGDITVETTMGPDYLVPRHWQCPRRLIDLTRLTKILFPIHLDPLCPTRSDFPPLLRAAQNHGLNTRTQEVHLRVLQWMLNSNQQKKELDVRLYITWKMMDTAESMKGVNSLIFPIMELQNLQSLQIWIWDIIEREADINPAKSAVFAAIELATRRRPDLRSLMTLNLLTEAAERGIDSHCATVKDSNWTALHEAASNGNEAEVRLSLDVGADIEARDTNGFTALHHAARSGQKEVVEILIEAGADINYKGGKGLTPLHLAASQGQETVARLLIERGADLEASDSLAGYTALHHAANNGQEPVLRLLLEHQGVGINARDNKSRTPLSIAISKKHQGSANLLLSHKDIDADARDDNGRSPLSLAAENGDEELVTLLLERGDIEVQSKDNGGRTPIEWVGARDGLGLRLRRQLLEHKSVSMEDISTFDAIFKVGTRCVMDSMPEEAEEMYKRAIEGKKKVVGLEHPSTLDSLHDLGIFYADRNRLTEAQEVLESVLKGYETTNGIDNTTIVTVVHSLGRLYRLQGNLSDAEKMLQRSVDAYEEINGSDHFQTLMAFYNLGLVYQDQGKLRQAQELFQKALIGLENEFGCSHGVPRAVLNSIDAIRKLMEEGPSQAP